MLSDGQAIAINQGLFNNQNLLVVLPTGSGKSLIGNLAMLESRNKNKQSIYLSPLRSLTNEQFIKFRDQYKKDFGGCILTTGEYKKADWLINKAPFIFTTAEKLDVLIRKNYHFLQNVGCVVIDELHTLNQESKRRNTRNRYNNAKNTLIQKAKHFQQISLPEKLNHVPGKLLQGLLLNPQLEYNYYLPEKAVLRLVAIRPVPG